ncbi:MAG: putative DNA binding domain-containing protein [Elusimicrobia bacterium]|nr:putative DNA binding domain-containing protein [Elusimicrobiota bacterium]
MTLKDLCRIVVRGESPRLELKRSTGELQEALQTACAFLNGQGGHVVVGAKPDGTLVGQQVSDKTLRDIAQAMEGFEPPARIEIERVPVAPGLEALVLVVQAAGDAIPFTFHGRPYERVQSTTRKMPQKRYEQLLLDRSHSKRRWENQEAEEIGLRDIDRDEVFRVVESAHAAGRLVGPVERNLVSVLERLNLAEGGKPLRAAVVLFGRRFMPDYPQCELRMARFRGTDMAEFLDQRQVRGPAFKLLEEAELFCQRHFPLPGRIVPGRMERLDRPLIPPDAMREILVNALIHRDYTIAGGAISLAIFDDRVEVWSAGALPSGITPEALSRRHLSILRNPIIADVFNRAGLIEKWGRGTNRVIDQCRRHGIPPPKFEEITGATVVTFRVDVGRTIQVTDHVTVQVTAHVAAVLKASQEPRSRGELQKVVGLRHRMHFLKAYLEPLLKAGWLEMTVPGKPKSRLQRYRATAAGLAQLQGSPDTSDPGPA